MLWLGIYYSNWALQYACYCQQENYCESESDESSVKADSLSSGRVLYDTHNLTILCCDPLCSKLGVQAGMSLDTAQALVPNMQLWPYIEEQAELAKDWLSQWSYGFSARVVPLVCELAKEEPQAIVANRIGDTLLLEVGSMASLFGGLGPLIQDYLAMAREHGLSAQFALADTPLAAQLLARYQPIITMEQMALFESDQDTQEKSKIHKTTDITRFVQQALFKLSVDCLPITSKMKARLHAMGLISLRDLTQISTTELACGELSHLIPLLGKLTGRLADPQCFYQPREYFHQKQILNYEVEYIQGLIFPLSRMFQELENYLRLHQLALLELKLLLTFRQLGAQEQVLVIAYPFAEHRAEALLALCRLQLENITLYQPVTELAIYVEHLLPLVHSQLSDEIILDNNDQFAPSNTAHAQKLQASLVARLGKDKLSWLTTKASHLPEQAWGELSIGGSNKEAKVSKGRAELLPQGLRPSWLLPVPSRLHSKDVVLLQGPERFSGPWWQEESIERDYYVAQHLKQEHQGLCWVYKDKSGLWLHGWFG